MNWLTAGVRIDWSRCMRRRWPPTPLLAFSPQERRKTRNVLLYWWVGRGQRRLPAGLVPIRPGLCHWARPGWTYACEQSPRNPLGVTAIHFDLLDACGSVISPDSQHLPPEQLCVRAPRLVEEVTRWIAERAMDVRAGTNLAPEMEQAANSLLRGLLLDLVHDTALPGSHPDVGGQMAWRRLTAHIQDHLHELGGVKELADRSGYTRSHFTRLFTRRIGISPQEYIIGARFALAKDLLHGTSLSVSAVAERTGYADVFHFSKQFKQRIGLTPSEYRARTLQ